MPTSSCLASLWVEALVQEIYQEHLRKWACDEMKARIEGWLKN